VTLLEVGSCIWSLAILRTGVCGGGISFSVSIIGEVPVVVSVPASIDSPLSKGLGRVDGSDETARSREGSLDSKSIW
jgi:hypothetical protein